MRLSEAHIDMLPKVAKRCFPGFLGDWQELLRAGEDGLLKAESKYISELGRFDSFAWKCIQNAMADFIRAENRRNRLKSVPLAHSPAVAEAEPELDHRDEMECLIADDVLRELLLLWIGHDISVRALAEKTGVKASTLYSQLETALERARKKPK